MRGVALALFLALPSWALAQAPTEAAAAEPAIEPAIEPAAEAVEPAIEPAIEPAAEAVAPAVDRTSLPTGRGLPVTVHVGVFFVDVTHIDENASAFEGTIDVRTTWFDDRLAYPAEEAAGGIRRIRDEAMDEALSAMWEPHLRIANLEGEPGHRLRGMRIAPTGAVEMLERITGRFHTSLSPEAFPFDTEPLSVEVVAEHESAARLTLVARQEDLDFSRVASALSLDDWDPHLVDLARGTIEGWHGERHARIVATLDVARRAERTAPPVFIPLLASLLIPLLALWLNRVQDGEVKIEAFELANVIVGGLFAVIALNFTVNAEYAPLSAGDNTVSRLFALNYALLATSLVINLLMFRFRVVFVAFGPHVEAEVFRLMMWAVPLLAFSTALAIVLAAAA